MKNFREVILGVILGFFCLYAACMFAVFAFPWPAFMLTPHFAASLVGQLTNLLVIIALSTAMLTGLYWAFKQKGNNLPILRRGLIGGYFMGYVLWFVAVKFF